MLSIELVVAFLIAVSALLALGWLVLAPYWEKRFMTDAARLEKEIQRKRMRPKKATRFSLELVGNVIWFGLPILFIADGLYPGLGLLYSPLLSFFNPFDTPFQVLGLAITLAGLVMMLKLGYILGKEVYAKAKEERRLITTKSMGKGRTPTRRITNTALLRGTYLF